MAETFQSLVDDYMDGDRAKDLFRELVEYAEEYMIDDSQEYRDINLVRTVTTTMKSDYRKGTISLDYEVTKDHIYRDMSDPLFGDVEAENGTDLEIPTDWLDQLNVAGQVLVKSIQYVDGRKKSMTATWRLTDSIEDKIEELFEPAWEASLEYISD